MTLFITLCYYMVFLTMTYHRIKFLCKCVGRQQLVQWLQLNENMHQIITKYNSCALLHSVKPSIA